MVNGQRSVIDGRKQIGSRNSTRGSRHGKQRNRRDMEILETETFRQAKKRLLSKREYQFIQRQILSPTRLVPSIRQSGGIRKLVWVGTIKGRRRKMQILYYYRTFSNSDHGVVEQITLLHICQLRGSRGLSLDQVRRLRSAVRDERRKS